MTEKEKDKLLVDKVKLFLSKDVNIEFVDSIAIQTFLSYGKLITNYIITVAEGYGTKGIELREFSIDKSQYAEILEFMQELDKYL